MSNHRFFRKLSPATALCFLSICAMLFIPTSSAAQSGGYSGSITGGGTFTCGTTSCVVSYRGSFTFSVDSSGGITGQESLTFTMNCVGYSTSTMTTEYALSGNAHGTSATLSETVMSAQGDDPFCNGGPYVAAARGYIGQVTSTFSLGLTVGSTYSTPNPYNQPWNVLTYRLGGGQTSPNTGSLGLPFGSSTFAAAATVGSIVMAFGGVALGAFSIRSGRNWAQFGHKWAERHVDASVVRPYRWVKGPGTQERGGLDQGGRPPSYGVATNLAAPPSQPILGQNGSPGFESFNLSQFLLLPKVDGRIQIDTHGNNVHLRNDHGKTLKVAVEGPSPFWDVGSGSMIPASAEGSGGWRNVGVYSLPAGNAMYCPGPGRIWLIP